MGNGQGASFWWDDWLEGEVIGSNVNVEHMSISGISISDISIDAIVAEAIQKMGTTWPRSTIFLQIRQR